MKSSNWIASFLLLTNCLLLALSNASVESDHNATSSFETSKVQTLSGWLNGTSFPKGLMEESNATISTESPQDSRDSKEFSYSTGEIVTIVTNSEVDKEIDQSNLYTTESNSNNVIGISTTTNLVDNVSPENFTTIQPPSILIKSESSAKVESREENGSDFNLPSEHRSEEEKVSHKSVHDGKHSDMSSQANTVKIKVADSKRKSLKSKVMKRLRANQAGGKLFALALMKMRPSIASRSGRNDKSSVKIYAGESGKKKGNIIVVANGGGGSSDGVKQHIVQHIVPIFTPIHDQSTFDDKLEDKSGHMNMFAQPIQPNMMAPVPIPHHHPMPQHQQSVDAHPHQWTVPGDGSGLQPPPSAMNMVRQTGRRTRHIMDNPLNDHHPLIHPMTETVNPDEPNLNMDETPRSSYNSMNLGDMLRGSLLAAAAGEPISPNSGDMNYDNSGSDKLGLKAFSLLSDSNSNIGSGYRPSSFMSATPNRYNDWPSTGGLVNNDDRLTSLLLEQSRSGIDYDRINGGDRLGLLGGHELSPSPLSAAKLTAASLLNDEVTLEDALKKLALFEILNKKQIPLTSQIFDEMRGQLGPGTGFHNHGFHQHLQHEVPNSPNDIKLLKSLRSKQKAQKEQDEEAASDVDDENGGKNSGNSKSKSSSERRNRSKRLRKTIQANMAKLKDQTDRLRSRLRGNRGGKEEEEDEYEDAGVEDEGEESRGKTRHEKPPTLARSSSRVLEASSTKQISSFIKSESLSTTTEKPHTHKTCHQCCFGKSNLEPAAVSAIKAILNTNNNKLSS